MHVRDPDRWHLQRLLPSKGLLTERLLGGQLLRERLPAAPLVVQLRLQPAARIGSGAAALPFLLQVQLCPHGFRLRALQLAMRFGELRLELVPLCLRLLFLPLRRLRGATQARL